MSDMTMCVNVRCPRKHFCYRFMAIPTHHQPYTSIENIDYDQCDFFIEIGKRPIRKLEKEE